MIVYRELKSIETDLGFPAKTLYGISNNIDKHYHNAFIPKSDGTKRKLSVPDKILKLVQKSIADNILAYYPHHIKYGGYQNSPDSPHCIR